VDFTQSRENTYARQVLEAVNFKQLAWSLAFALVMIFVSAGAGWFVETRYPNPVRPDDLILDSIPEIEIFVTVGEVVGAAQALLSLYMLGQRRFKDMPALLFQLSVLFILRSIAITLTPLAQIQNPAEHFGENHLVARYTYKGMFFSGHTGSACTQYLFFARRGYGWLVRVHLMLAILQAVSMLASHSHYTIDVFAALFVAYFVTHHDFTRWIPDAWRHWHWAPWSV